MECNCCYWIRDKALSLLNESHCNSMVVQLLPKNLKFIFFYLRKDVNELNYENICKKKIWRIWSLTFLQKNLWLSSDCNFINLKIKCVHLETEYVQITKLINQIDYIYDCCLKIYKLSLIFVMEYMHSSIFWHYLQTLTIFYTDSSLMSNQFFFFCKFKKSKKSTVKRTAR